MSILSNVSNDSNPRLITAMRAALGNPVSDDLQTVIKLLDTRAVEASDTEDAHLGHEVRMLMVQQMRAIQVLKEKVEEVNHVSNKAGVFTFGSHADFTGGLQTLIGLPQGLNEEQWLQVMRREHCDVESGWGASYKQWTTGNYRLETTPRREFIWVYGDGHGNNLEVSTGEKLIDGAYIVGGYSWDDGSEIPELRRKPARFETLFSTAGEEMHKRLMALNADEACAINFSLSREQFLDMFRAQRVNRAEILGLRLYSGPLFEMYNSVLRAQGDVIPWGNSYPMEKGMRVTGRFVTTIHAVNSGILKLSTLTPVVTGFRGLASLNMPKQLLEADEMGSRLGIEFGFLSTTTDKAVAIKYGQDRDTQRNLSNVFEFPMDGLNRGAVIQFISQYPGESEILFGPMTGLEVVRTGKLHGTMNYFTVRPTVNQRAVLIEVLVQQRKVLHQQTLENLCSELKPALEPTVLHWFKIHMAFVGAIDGELFNDDRLYLICVNTAFSIKQAFELIGSSLRHAHRVLGREACGALEDFLLSRIGDVLYLGFDVAQETRSTPEMVYEAEVLALEVQLLAQKSAHKENIDSIVRAEVKSMAMMTVHKKWAVAAARMITKECDALEDTQDEAASIANAVMDSKNMALDADAALDAWGSLEKEQQDNLRAKLGGWSDHNFYEVDEEPQKHMHASHTALKSDGPETVILKLLQRGLGACVNELVRLPVDVVETTLNVVESAQLCKKIELGPDDVVNIPFSPSVATVFAQLLMKSDVRSVGCAPVRALVHDAITEVNLMGKEQSACASGLIAFYFHRNSRFDRIIVNAKLTIDQSKCSNRDFVELTAKGIGAADLTMVAAILATKVAENATTVDISKAER